MLKNKLKSYFSITALLIGCALSLSVPAADLGDLDCVIEPHMVIDLSSRVDGIIDSVEVDRGQLIEKNQVLVKLEAGVERASVAEARVRAEAQAEILAREASLEFAQRRNDRLEQLYQSQAVSTDQLDEIVTENELSRLQLQQARENKEIAELELRQAVEVLNRHTLRSPIRGIVVQRYLSPGESVEEQPVMRIAQIDPLRVEVIVPVSAFGKIKVGQRAVVRPESPMEGEYAATVTIVDGVADAASGTFRVRLGLPNEDYALPSGLKCRVSFLPMQEVPGTQMAATELAPVTAEDAEPAVATPLPVASEESVSAKVSPATVAAKPSVAATKLNVSPVSSAAADDVGRCRTIGPLSAAPEAEKIMATLTEQATQVELREEQDGSVDAWLLMSPTQASMADSRALTEKLKAAGVNDFQIIWRGPNKGRVSMGLFSKKNLVESHQAKLTDLGFETEILPHQQKRSSFWLDVELLPRITALDLAEAQQTLGKADLDAAPCSVAAQ